MTVTKEGFGGRYLLFSSGYCHAVLLKRLSKTTVRVDYKSSFLLLR
jgi:hypothetical protein